MFGSLGPMEIGLILLFGVLLFGKRLPSVGRSIGQSIVEFKKGYRGLEEELDGASTPAPAIEQQGGAAPTSDQIRPPQRITPSAPKFEDNSSAVTTPPQV